MPAKSMKEAHILSDADVNELLASVHARCMERINKGKKKANPEGLMSIEAMSYIFNQHFEWHLIRMIRTKT